MSRESFLERVRQAAQVGQAHRVHLHPVPPDAGYVGCDGDVCQSFAAEVVAVGGIAHEAADVAEAGAVLGKLLDEMDGDRASALCWQHELLTRLGLAELLTARGIERLDYVTLAGMSPEKRREAMLACQIGITSCDWAIAETGSLLMCSRSGRERVASLLPPVHVAVVERAQIVPDLIDAIGLLGGQVERNSFRSGQDPSDVERNSFRPMNRNERNGMNSVLLPSNAVLITGPSKTGDIELQLTTGVHGPGTWHVVVIQK